MVLEYETAKTVDILPVYNVQNLLLVYFNPIWTGGLDFCLMIGGVFNYNFEVVIVVDVSLTCNVQLYGFQTNYVNKAET